MLLKFLGVVVLGTLVVAEIPSYIKVCGRKDPKLAECVQSSVEGLREKLRTGMPELNVPPLEPLKIKGLPLSDTEQLRAYATNVNLYGVTDFEVNDLKVDLEKKQIDIDLKFKKIVIDADYDVKAKILVPIEGRGPIHITASDVNAKVTMKYKFIKKNGGNTLFFTTMTTKLDIKDYTTDFRPENGPDSDVLATAVNAAIQGGHKEILESITPTMEKVISEDVLRLANKVCERFTYDELFPDRE